MNTEEILEGDLTILECNKLIAEFMGMYVAPFNGTYHFVYQNKEQSNNPAIWLHRLEEMKYHKSLDCLMDVIDKIHSTPAIIFEFTISLIPHCRIIYCPKNKQHHHFNSQEIQNITYIQAIYNCAVEFIRWYTNQNQTK